MARVAARIPDRRVLRLIRSYLTAGVLNNGLFEISREGTPQGGPLSPLLSNLVLDELDRELERRGHRFVRYADDCDIYVRSEEAGHRVMVSLTRFIEGRLKLQVNAQRVPSPGRGSGRSLALQSRTIRNRGEHRRQGRRSVQRPSARTDTATSRGQPGTDDCRPEPAAAGMGRIFRLQSVARVGIAGRLDTAAPTLRCLGPVEDAGQSLSRTSSPEGH